MTKPTDRDIFHYTTTTLYPGCMPPVEISLLLTVVRLIAQRESLDEQEIKNQQAALKHIQLAIQHLEGVTT